MLHQLRQLAAYANSRGVVPGLALVHVNNKGQAWATDGEVELYLPKSPFPNQERWAVDAAQFAKVVNAASMGHSDSRVDAELDDQGNLSIAKGKFQALIPLADGEHHLPAMAHDLKPKSNATVTVEFKNPGMVTEALRSIAPFAAQDASAGRHWTAVLLRKGALYASNQGFSVVCAAPQGEKALAKAGELLIPARACAAIGEATATKLLINSDAGLGAFVLKDGEVVVFRMIEQPEEGFPDAGEFITQNYPGEEFWSELDENFTIGVSQAMAVADDKDPRVTLENDEGGWLLFATGKGSANVELEDFESEGGTVTLSQRYWTSLLNVASELAPVGDMWFRSDLEVDKGQFTLTGFVSGFVEQEPEESEEENDG